MKKICFLAAGEYPLPAVRGGAVETILQNLIDCNETEARLDITVLTIRDKAAAALYPRYRHTRFVAVPAFRAANRLYWKLAGFCRKCFHREILAPLQRRAELRFLRRNRDRFDFFIEELGPDVFAAARFHIPAEKKICHLHWEGAPTRARDTSFGYLLTVSDYIRGQWLAATGRAPGTAVTLRNCIRVSQFAKTLGGGEKAALRRELGIPDGHVVLLYVGRIVPEKGLRELICAVDRLSRGDLTLLLVGSSHFGNRQMTGYEKEIAALAARSTHPVIPTGFVPNAEIYRYQNIADIAVIPSIWNEPGALSVLEAQAAGLPVIASRTGGTPELLGPGAGLLVDPGSRFAEELAAAIEKLAADPGLRARMASCGREWAARHDTAAYYRRFVATLENLGQSADRPMARAEPARTEG